LKVSVNTEEHLLLVVSAAGGEAGSSGGRLIDASPTAHREAETAKAHRG